MTAIAATVEGNLAAIAAADTRGMATAGAEVTKRRTRALQLVMRGAVTDAFGGSRGGRRAGNAVRSRVYTDGELHHRGIVWSKFGRGSGAGFEDYLKPFAEGATLRAKGGGWLYIPGRGRRGTRAGSQVDVAALKNVDFVPAADGRKVYIVRRTRTRSTIIGMLVRQVRINRRLDVERLVDGERRVFERAFAEALGRELRA